jgi:hypothetical protein
MRPRILVAMLLAIGSISSAAVLFLDKSDKSTIKRNGPQYSIEIKWGEGSEAGVPEAEPK